MGVDVARLLDRTELMVHSCAASGDFTVLLERQRRALRVHLGSDVTAGFNVLRAAVARAVEERHD